MKITAIRVYQVDLPLREGRYNWSGGNFMEVFDSTVVAVDTDALPGRERPRRIVADAGTMMAETAPRIVPPGRATNTPETAPQDFPGQAGRA